MLLCELSTWLFNFLFDGFIKDGSETQMGFHQTHLYLFLEQIVDLQIYTSSLQHWHPYFSSDYLRFADIWHTGFSCDLCHDQYHVWHHCPFRLHWFCGGVKIIVIFHGDHTRGNSWKVLKCNFYPGNTWKVLEFQHFLENILECTGILWKYFQKKFLFMNERVIFWLHCISSILILFYLKEIQM